MTTAYSAVAEATTDEVKFEIGACKFQLNSKSGLTNIVCPTVDAVIRGDVANGIHGVHKVFNISLKKISPDNCSLVPSTYGDNLLYVKEAGLQPTEIKAHLDNKGNFSNLEITCGGQSYRANNYNSGTAVKHLVCDFYRPAAPYCLEVSSFESRRQHQAVVDKLKSQLGLSAVETVAGGNDASNTNK